MHIFQNSTRMQETGRPVAVVATACVLLALVVWQAPPSSAPESLVSVPEARPASAEAVLRYATWHRDGGEKVCGLVACMYTYMHIFIHIHKHIHSYMHEQKHPHNWNQYTKSRESHS